jgi:hypothetical protein
MKDKRLGHISEQLKQSFNPDNVGILLATLNRWYLIVFVLLLTVIFLVVYSVFISKKVIDNKEIVYVKLSPDGTWFIDINDTNEIDFYTSTVDHLIGQYVKRRYQEVPYSVKADYGFALLLMHEQLGASFSSAAGFNAPGKAAQIASCQQCGTVEVEIRDIYHYDKDKTVFGRNEGTLYRTNVYINVIDTAKDGTKSDVATTKKIVALQWRLLPKAAIPVDKHYLMLNPLGLQIMMEELLNDAS